MESVTARPYYSRSCVLTNVKLFRDYKLNTRNREFRLLPSAFQNGLVLTLTAVMLWLTSTGPVAAENSVSERYSLYCSVCHGDRGNGARHAQQGLVPPPRDFTDPAFGSAVSRERLVAAITNGVPGTAMIAWRTELSETEIGELADFILNSFIARPEPSVVVSQTTPAPDEAMRIYQEACSVCHGDDGKGAVWGQRSLAAVPRNFTTAQAKTELTRERMIKSVTHGRPGTPMPGFGTQLNGEQIAAVVDHIRTRFMGADYSEASAVALTSDYHERPFPGSLVGDFERGRSLYFQNCIECHGATGDGDGPRAYFIFPRPRDFHEEATRETMNRPRLYDAVADGVNGREMPAWRFVFAAQDIADVSEFVYREFIATAGGTATP